MNLSLLESVNIYCYVFRAWAACIGLFNDSKENLTLYMDLREMKGFYTPLTASLLLLFSGNFPRLQIVSKSHLNRLHESPCPRKFKGFYHVLLA
jgi:hypothetical protein